MASDDTRKLAELNEAADAALVKARELSEAAQAAGEGGDSAAHAEALQSAEKALADAKEQRAEAEKLQSVIDENARNAARISGELAEMAQAAQAEREQAAKALNRLAAPPADDTTNIERENAQGAKLSADFRPYNYDRDLHPSAQHAHIRKDMGANLQAADAAYQSAFRALARNQMNMARLEFADPESYRTMAQAITTGIGSEAWLPNEFIEQELSVDPGLPGAPLREACTVVPAPGKKGKFPTFEGVEFNRARVVENAEITAASEMAGDVEWDCETIALRHVLSNQSLRDVPIPLESQITAAAVRALLRFYSIEVAAGTGTTSDHGQFMGLRTSGNVASANAQTAASATEVTAADTRGLLGELPAQWRDQDARFYTTSEVAEQVFASMVATGNLDERNINPYGTLHGLPVMLYDGSEGWQAVATGNEVAAVGAFRNYYIFERGGLTVATSEHANFNSNGFVIRITAAVDGRIGQDGAFALLSMA